MRSPGVKAELPTSCCTRVEALVQSRCWLRRAAARKVRRCGAGCFSRIIGGKPVAPADWRWSIRRHECQRLDAAGGDGCSAPNSIGCASLARADQKRGLALSRRPQIVSYPCFEPQSQRTRLVEFLHRRYPDRIRNIRRLLSCASRMVARYGRRSACRRWVRRRAEPDSGWSACRCGTLETRAGRDRHHPGGDSRGNLRVRA